jgi:diadenosine tetraphosphate (Ap4A) HIT family hydrolase
MSRNWDSAVLYEDDLVRIIIPSQAHISPEDGGHLIVEPRIPHTGIEACSRELRYRLIDAVAAASAAMLSLPHMAGGIVNVQDNGNWFDRDGTGRSPKRLHIHIYGRAPGATEQKFGEALRFPAYAERHKAARQPFQGEDEQFLHKEIISRMKTMLS